jgi:hypothetical protein
MELTINKVPDLIGMFLSHVENIFLLWRTFNPIANTMIIVLLQLNPGHHAIGQSTGQ